MEPFSFAIITGIIAGIGTAGIIYLFERSPKVRAWFKRIFIGLDFLVVGDDGVGKTSFYNFLQHNEYADNFPTKHTLEISDKMSFNVKKGGDLEFQVRRAFDIPGPLSPQEQVNQICKRDPEVLIVFLSADKTETNMSQWFRAFLKSLSNSLVTDRKLSDKLKCMIVVLNKVDLISNDEKNKRLKKIESLIDELLKPVLGKNVRLIDVYPCTLYKEHGGEKAANQIVLSIVDAIKIKQRLVRK